MKGEGAKGKKRRPKKKKEHAPPSSKRKPGLLSQAAFGLRWGVSQQAVSQAVKSGRIPTVGGRIDPEVADAAWQANTDPSTPRNSLTGDPASGRRRRGKSAVDWALWRARRERAEALQAELALQEERGQLGRIPDMRTAAFNLARKARDMLLSLPPRVSPIVTGLTDEADCRDLLEKEIQLILSELSAAEAPTSPKPNRKRR